ncbi:hypothetical protein SAMN05421507_10822 [Lentzea jiangxiensis]|uniref:Uncharacterized protein n=1 Tax=Lentzea jiangxiensis TaxID=641025 RepID=A0A1H0SE52_9PSEU|nr:hypothetical protein SAMN05421507_10822 [Lentzea jiangxiensis]
MRNAARVGRRDLAEPPEVLLAGRTGREQQQHLGRRVGVVAEGVQPALRHVQEVTRPRRDPPHADVINVDLLEFIRS